MSELTVEKIRKVCGFVNSAEIKFLLSELDTIEKQTAEKCAQIALDLNEHCGCGYHISRKIQEDFGVDV